MYYRLGTLINTMNVSMRATNNRSVSLSSGAFIDPSALELPFRYEMTVAPGETPRMDAWFPSACLMSTSLIEAIQEAGIDNIQVFPATVVHEGAADRHAEYCAVNVVGVVASLNIGLSDVQPIGEMFFCHSIVIDGYRARPHVMFRLAESVMEILIHVEATEVIHGQFTGMSFDALTENEVG